MKLITKIRLLIIFFMVALIVSGATAMPAETGLHWLMQYENRMPARLGEWLRTCYGAIKDTNTRYPFLAYGYDWLAFAHFMIALSLLGPLQNPVKNSWIIDWLMICCVCVFPLALIAGPIRQIPTFHLVIDCAFGVLGIIPLLICRTWIKQLSLINPVPSDKPQSKPAGIMKVYSYLALGDSYTVGEQVPIYDSFPYQAVQILRRDSAAEGAGKLFYAPEIVAKTGWTTAELLRGISKHILLPVYDVVTLLIGVNNQYRGSSIDVFQTEFKELLLLATQFAGGDVSRVYVLSIPDWGITPFAAERSAEKIAREIEGFNEICRQTSGEAGVRFIDITTAQREHISDTSLVAADGLHPSGREYHNWAKQLAALVLGREPSA